MMISASEKTKLRYNHFIKLCAGFAMPFKSPSSAEIDALIAEITNQDQNCIIRAAELRGHLDLLAMQSKLESPHIFSSTYWQAQSCIFSLEKIATLIKSELSIFANISILAVARHIFETHIWLKTIVLDYNSGMLFYRNLLKSQIDHNDLMVRKFMDEVEILNRFDNEDRKLHSIAISEVGTPTDKYSADLLVKRHNELTNNLDNQARRTFCLTAKSAKINGYSFQAYLVKTKLVPEYEKRRAQLVEMLSNLDNYLLNSDIPFLRALPKSKKKWNWKERATDANMNNEYNFIYSYASMLLHATPMSLITPVSLDNDERRVFLEYIYV